MKKSMMLIGVVAGLLIIGGGFWFMQRDTDGVKPNTTSPTTNASNTKVAPTDISENTIIYTDRGFEPRSIRVSEGAMVTIKNDSSEALQFSSNPHPVHMDNPDLNIPTVEPGASTTIKMTQKGTWGVHNHARSTDTVTIVVE